MTGQETAASHDHPHRHGYSLAYWTAVALLGAYVAAQRGRIASYDGSIMAHLAHRILFDHALTIEPSDDLMGLQHPYASYGIGTTLWLLPFVWLQSLFAPGRQQWITLANPVVLAACGALVTRIGLALHWRPCVAFLSGLGFGLLTPALWQSTELMADPGVALGLLLSVLGLVTMPRAALRGALWLGLGGALCMLFRLDSVVLIVPFLALAFAVQQRRARTSPPSLVAALIPIGSALLFQAWYNAHRYGSVLEAGYASQSRGRGFSTPIVDGLSLLLLLLALPGALLLYRRGQALTLTLGGMCVVRFLFFAKWWTPWGGVSWGPRLLFPITGLMALAAGESLERMRGWPSPLRRRLAGAGVVTLALISAGISILSISILPSPSFRIIYLTSAEHRNQPAKGTLMKRRARSARVLDALRRVHSLLGRLVNLLSGVQGLRSNIGTVRPGDSTSLNEESGEEDFITEGLKHRAG